MSFFVLWFGVMFPLVFSPGPANIVFAAAGANQGLKHSLPLMFGIDCIFILKSLLIGLGLGSVIHRYPQLLQLLQFIGALYIVYLAFGFLGAGIGKQTGKHKTLGFRDGVVIQLLNAKGWIMVFLMFSLFTEAAGQIFGEATIFVLVLMLALLNVCTHLIWISAGELITKLVARRSNQKLQAYVCFFSLLTVAGWLFMANPYWGQ